MKRRLHGGQLVTAGLFLSVGVVFLLALFDPTAAIIPAAIVTGWVWMSARADHHTARRAHPCTVCGKRFRLGDMVEHHSRDHRECAS